MWEAEFSDGLQSTRTREERLRTIETMIQQLREKNFMLDETVHPYKNLLVRSPPTVSWRLSYRFKKGRERLVMTICAPVTGRFLWLV